MLLVSVYLIIMQPTQFFLHFVEFWRWEIDNVVYKIYTHQDHVPPPKKKKDEGFMLVENVYMLFFLKYAQKESFERKSGVGRVGAWESLFFSTQFCGYF